MVTKWVFLSSTLSLCVPIVTTQEITQETVIQEAEVQKNPSNTDQRRLNCISIPCLYFSSFFRAFFYYYSFSSLLVKQMITETVNPCLSVVEAGILNEIVFSQNSSVKLQMKRWIAISLWKSLLCVSFLKQTLSSQSRSLFDTFSEYITLYYCFQNCFN